MTTQQIPEFSPSFISDANTIERIEFPGGAWVDIRAHLTVGESDAIRKAARKTKTRSVTEGKSRQTRVESYIDFDEGVFILSFLEAVVVAWSDQVAISRESLVRMPESMSARIRARYDELNPDAESAEGKASDTESGEPSASAEEESFPESWPG